jgi:hypothetical protein
MCACGLSNEQPSAQNLETNEVEKDPAEPQEPETPEPEITEPEITESSSTVSLPEIIPDVVDELTEDVKVAVEIPKEAQHEGKSFFDSMKDKNRLDMMYSVHTSASKVVMPRFCTCCMKPTTKYEHSEEVSAYTSRSSGYETTTRTRSISFPLCSECVAHRQAIINKKRIVNCISIAAGFILMIVFTALNILNHTWMFPILVSLATYCTLGFLIKLNPLDAQHSAREQSATMSFISFDSDYVNFTFSNWAFAELFAVSNNTKTVEVRKRNHVKEDRLLRAMKRPIANGVFVLCMTLLVMFITFMFIGGRSSSSSAVPPAPTVRPPATPATEIQPDESQNEVNVIPGTGGTVQVDEETFFAFIPDQTGFWALYTTDNGGDDPYLTVLDPDGEVVGIDDDSGEDLNAFLIIYLVEGIEYQIRAGFFGDVSYGYQMTIEKSYLPSIPSIGGVARVTEATAFLFTPSNTGTWVFGTSHNENHDPMLGIYDVHRNLIKEDDDSGDELNALITIDLEAGVVYIVVVRFFMADTGSCLLTVTKA